MTVAAGTCCGRPTPCCGPAPPPASPRTRAGPPISAAADRQTAALLAADALAVYNLVRAVTHPYPGAFTFFRGRKLFIWAGQALAAPVTAPSEPGLITAAVPGEGLLVATGAGHFLITQAQWEDEPEFLGPVVATWDYLVGKNFRRGAPACASSTGRTQRSAPARENGVGTAHHNNQFRKVGGAHPT